MKKTKRFAAMAAAIAVCAGVTTYLPQDVFSGNVMSASAVEEAELSSLKIYGEAITDFQFHVNEDILNINRIKACIFYVMKSLTYKNGDVYLNLKEIVNVSLRQTVLRCIITTVTTLLPVISLIFLGSHEIINFNIALLFGLIVGTFSSLFISSQIWMLIEKRRIGKDPNKHWYDDNKKEKEELQVKGINC